MLFRHTITPLLQGVIVKYFCKKATLILQVKKRGSPMPNPLDALFLLLKLFLIFLTISFLINLAFKLKNRDIKIYATKMKHPQKRRNNENFNLKAKGEEKGDFKGNKKPSIALKSTVIPQNKQNGKAYKRTNR